MLAEDELEWICQYCGTENTVWADLTVTGKQDFVEDCRICCRPNRIIITVNDYDEVLLEARMIDE